MQQFIGFHINSSEYMIPILRVREIITMPAITKMPHLPDYIKGITNLRGTVIPIVQLKSLLNTPDNGEDGNTIIVLTLGKITFGIIIDGISGVLQIDEANIDPPEGFINDNVDLMLGVAKINGKLVVLLDTKKLLPLDDLAMLDETVLDVQESEDGLSVEVTTEVDTIGGKVSIKELRDAKDYFKNKDTESSSSPDSQAKIFDLMLSFMEAMSVHDYTKVESLVAQLVKETDSGLFKEVGKVTRKLHDSLEEFKGSVDTGLAKITETDVPNAVDKLQFVMEKTEDAANKTMAIVESYFEESDDFQKHLDALQGSEESKEYIKLFKDSLDNNMTMILTAQQFQDITGQTIRKVIHLVNKVETELLRLITQFGMPVTGEGTAVSVPTANYDAELGTTEDHEKITQSDVESLLNDFGF
ncbi:MAG: protein phosphatase CheZ [Nitrospira sp.]|nr:protein phosphatase CheZ [Candidatus Brocadiales bacterium]MBL7048070.1 protein phosphatase CheZ [Nitrospira sp.]